MATGKPSDPPVRSDNSRWTAPPEQARPLPGSRRTMRQAAPVTAIWHLGRGLRGGRCETGTYVTHADSAGLEAYVDKVSAPSKFSIFWEMEQGSVMRLAGIPMAPSEAPALLDAEMVEVFETAAA
jgi:hypothetical protein